MSIILLFILAVGLSMDAFAVSVSNGMCYRNIGKKQALMTALIFGLFQGVMPMVGYYGGRLAKDIIASMDHWIALVLLCFIGGCMVWESLREMRLRSPRPTEKELDGQTLLVQGIATSIDALAVGISLAALQTNIAAAAGLIALVTFVVCLFGALIGERFGRLMGQQARVCGGLLLIAIGIKIFTQHVFL